MYTQYRSIQDRAAGQKTAVSTSTAKMIENQERASSGFSGNQDVYLRQMTETHQRYAQDQIAAVRAGADQAADGATRGTSIAMGGIKRGASVEVQSNRTMLKGSVSAAGQIRDASLQAARLHMTSAIVHQLTRAAARQIEQGLTLRY